jgi:hypothetical protein
MSSSGRSAHWPVNKVMGRGMNSLRIDVSIATS